MLDLSLILAQMTQGQAPAEMTPLGTGPSAPAGAQAGEAAARAGTPSTAPTATLAAPGAPVDPRLIADRVYELMRRDLLVQIERQGGR